MAETRLSQEAYDRLAAELEDLTTRGRVEVADLIEKARALGDLSENGDYHAAKEQQGIMEMRIRSIQAMLKEAVIAEGTTDIVSVGSIVAIKYEDDDEAETYLVGSIEEKAGMPVISPDSPLGKSLLGKKPGEIVEFAAPSGALLKVEVVSIGT